MAWAVSEQVSVAGSCEKGDEVSGSVKGGGRGG
jgi:hypothetical protein